MYTDPCLFDSYIQWPLFIWFLYNDPCLFDPWCVQWPLFIWFLYTVILVYLTHHVYTEHWLFVSYIQWPLFIWFLYTVTLVSSDCLSSDHYLHWLHVPSDLTRVLLMYIFKYIYTVMEMAIIFLLIRLFLAYCSEIIKSDFTLLPYNKINSY